MQFAYTIICGNLQCNLSDSPRSLSLQIDIFPHASIAEYGTYRLFTKVLKQVLIMPDHWNQMIIFIMDPKNWTTRKASFLSSGKG